MADPSSFLSGFWDKLGFAKFNIGAGVIGNVLLLTFLGVLIFGLVGGLIYIWWRKKLYNQTVKIYGLVGNIPMLKQISPAKYTPFGKAGDRLLFIKKRKKYMPSPTIQAGRNEWWYWEREDGELINIGMENVDAKMRTMKIKFVDADMRMQRLGIVKNLEFRLEKKSFWDKIKDILPNLIFYVLVTLCLVVLFMQLKGLSAEIGNMGSAVVEMAREVRSFYESTPSYRPTGTGLTPALFLLLRRKK